MLRKFVIAGLLFAGPSVWAEVEPPPTASPVPTVAATPEVPPAERKALAQERLLQGRELQRQGFTDSAIVNYRQAIELDPDLAQAYIELGQIALDTRNQGFAITIYENLARLQPENLQWKQTLFDLYSSYEKPQEAAEVGEVLVLSRPTDLELLKTLAQQYEASGLTERYADTLVRAAAVSKDAALWYQAAEAYLSVGKSSQALEAYRQAVALQPGNFEYQAGLGRGLAAEDPYQARDYYEGLFKANPEAQGIKDRLAETEIAIGDRLLERRRFVGARDAYRRAQDLLGPTPDLTARIAKAERLNHVYFENFSRGGQQGDNHFFWMDNIVGVPLPNTDLTLQAIADNRWVGADNQPLPVQSMTSVLAGADYKIDEFSNVYAQAGTNQIFRVGGFYQDDKTTAGLRVRRDVVSYTPLGLNTRLRWTGVDGLFNRQLTDFFGIGGDLAFNSYTDGITERIYNISPYFTPVNRPQDFIWSILYNHGGVFNDRMANPLLRFGPTNFQVDSIGTNIQHWLSPDFVYRLGYYRSLSNTGIGGNTYVAGFDAQLGEGSYAWLTAEYGSFLGGRILPGVFSNSSNNNLIQGGFRFTF